MSCPRVFISSTYYDLKHVREIIRDFVNDLGYEAVLSEFSDIFYNPSDTVQNSCLSEIACCDLFVLIVGKRYGSLFPGDKLSITHREYIEAQNQLIPIYAFIDLDVLHDFEFYERNSGINGGKYRVVEDENVFKLIKDIRAATANNLLIPYTSVSDLLLHLRKQWANLFANQLRNEKLKHEQNVNKSKPVQEHPNLDLFNQFLSQFGIKPVNQQQINEANTFSHLIELMGGSIQDLGTDYKVNLDGVLTNIGKAVVSILEHDMADVKTE